MEKGKETFSGRSEMISMHVNSVKANESMNKNITTRVSIITAKVIREMMGRRSAKNTGVWSGAGVGSLSAAG